MFNKTTTRLLPVALLPIALLMSACTGGARTAQQVELAPVDASGGSRGFLVGYNALKKGENVKASDNLQLAYNLSPKDPYDSLNLGAAYQNQGMIEKALPLYRETIKNGRGVYPAEYTQADARGLPLDDLAKLNMARAGYDWDGNRIAAAQTTTVTTPAPVVTPTQMTYQVYFNFDKSDLTPEARRILRGAADNAKQGGNVRITVTGHTDTSGTNAYNQKLSERRAESAARQLMADGVSGGEIVTKALGENGLLVATADGIREPGNRRVEIVMEGRITTTAPSVVSRTDTSVTKMSSIATGAASIGPYNMSPYDYHQPY